MKTKTILFFTLIFLFLTAASDSLAQKVTVTPKKTTYRRTKAEFEEKKTFSVVRPIVKGLTPALNKKVENALSYEKLFNLNIKEEINEVQWLSEANYEVDSTKTGF